MTGKALRRARIYLIELQRRDRRPSKIVDNETVGEFFAVGQIEIFFRADAFQKRVGFVMNFPVRGEKKFRIGIKPRGAREN